MEKKDFIGIARVLSSDIYQANLSEVIWRQCEQIHRLKGVGWKWESYCKTKGEEKILSKPTLVKQQLSLIKFRVCFGFWLHRVGL